MTDLEQVIRKLEEIRDADKSTTSAVSALNGEVKALSQQLAGLESWMKSYTEKQDGVAVILAEKVERAEREARSQLDAFATKQREEIATMKDALGKVSGVVDIIKWVLIAMSIPVLGMMGIQAYKVLSFGVQ